MEVCSQFDYTTSLSKQVNLFHIKLSKLYRHENGKKTKQWIVERK